MFVNLLLLVAVFLVAFSNASFLKDAQMEKTNLRQDEDNASSVELEGSSVSFVDVSSSEAFHE